ncbi:MAG: DNA translocase FtsK 4TM domain-containing protein, partial [Candidatus Binatia bacterium]
MARGRTAVKQADEREASQLLNEVVGVVTFAAAIFALLSFLSFRHGQTNLGGPVGYGLSSALMQAFGLAVYLLPVLLAVLGARLFRSRPDAVSLARGLAAVTLVLSVAVMLGLLLPQYRVVHAGGWFGGFVASLLRDACGTLGAYVVAAVFLLLASMFTTGASLQTSMAAAAGSTREAIGQWRTRRQQRRARARLA